MLQRLSIQNYAIIEQVEIDFSDKLTILTGETGAGKSILIGALSLIVGERADTSVLYEKERKCIVEGYFNVEDYGLKSFFTDHDLDYEAVTIVRREINAKGRSRAFINDTPVNLSVLKKLGRQLVDIHAQHESLELGATDFQIQVIDSFAQHQKQLKEYQDKYTTYRQLKSELQELQDTHTQARKDLDYYQFQFNELNEADLTKEEQEKLEEEYKTLNNAEKIKQNLLEAVNALEQGEHTVTDQVNQIQQVVREVKEYNKRLEAIYERLESTKIELTDIGRELADIEETTTYDPQRIETIDARLNTIYKLQQKHGVDTIEELLAVKDKLDEKIRAIDSDTEKLEQLEKEIKQEKSELDERAKILSENRQKQIPVFQKKVNKLLTEVGMPFAQVKVDHEYLEEGTLNKYGKDRLRFLFSPDKGKTLLPIKKVASGGEMSRLMLSIKSLIASYITLPTLIFDEIDTGVSGETAVRVGGVLKSLAHAHQVICITHLPQIAGKGDRHYFIFKEMEKGRTKTKIRHLEAEDRVRAIAQMLSGEEPTPVAMENAKELLGSE